MKMLIKMPNRINALGSPILAIVCALFALTLLPQIALGDTLELKTGQILQGKFVGGSPLNIRFQVNGQEQVFPTKDVLNLGFSGDFSDSSNPSNAGAPPVYNPAPAPAPPPANVPPAPVITATSATAPGPDTAPAPPASYPTPYYAAPSQNSAVGQAITIPAGTSLLVRMIDGVDSSKNKIGDSFYASLESALTVGDTVVAPAGADVYGKLSQAKEAGKISGNSQLTLELTGVRINGNIVTVDSTDYDVAGKGRGKQSAERIGGGAVAGAVLGAIIGGGKGAAVGATLGAGGGTAVQVLTHGDQVRVPSETLLEFKLQQDVTVPLPRSSN